MVGTGEVTCSVLYSCLLYFLSVSRFSFSDVAENMGNGLQPALVPAAC